MHNVFLDDVCSKFDALSQGEEDLSNHRECLISITNNKMMICILNADGSVFMQFEYEESEFYEATQGIDDSYSFQVECGTLEILWIIQAWRRMLGYNHNHSDVVGTISLIYEITSHDDTLMPCLRISPNLGHDSEEPSLDVLVQESPTDFTQFKNQ